MYQLQVVLSSLFIIIIFYQFFHPSVSWKYSYFTEYKWQRVSSSLRDSSENSGQLYQWTPISHFHPSFQAFGDRFKFANYNWYYLPNPSARAGYDTRSIFKRSLTGLNSEFSFS